MSFYDKWKRYKKTREKKVHRLTHARFKLIGMYWWAKNKPFGAICNQGLDDFFELQPASTHKIEVELHDYPSANAYQITECRKTRTDVGYYLTLDSEFTVYLTHQFGTWLSHHEGRWISIREL